MPSVQCTKCDDIQQSAVAWHRSDGVCDGTDDGTDDDTDGHTNRGTFLAIYTYPDANRTYSCHGVDEV